MLAFEYLLMAEIETISFVLPFAAFVAEYCLFPHTTSVSRKPEIVASSRIFTTLNTSW